MSLFSDTVLCACGCGLPAPIAKQSDTKHGIVRGQVLRCRAGHNHRSGRTDGFYPQRYQPTHPRARHGCISEHVLIAERALGRYLPKGAEVHHCDGSYQNNTPSNLVICQNHAYHKLLHVRTRIVKAGGNPNTEKFCGDCQRCLPFAAFNRSKGHSLGLQSVCRECSKIRFEKNQHGRSSARGAA